MANRTSDSKTISGHLNRYLEVIGLQPGATLDDVNRAYFTIVKTMPENPTEEDEARIQELKRAYDMLRRAYVPQEEKGFEVLFDRRYLAPAAGVLAAIMVVLLVVMNYGTIRMKLVRYEPGAMLRLKSQTEPYGQVTGYEARHRFPNGNPSAAYSIRLRNGGETVWVSERLVVNDMARAQSK